MNKTILLSFVIPCYRSEHTIEKVIEEIIQVVHEKEEYDYEIIAVNDCSPDHVYEVLRKIAKNNQSVKVINLAKNMGKHNAVMAGYSFVKGDYVVNLDDDFQSPIDQLWLMMEPLVKDECDIVTAMYTRKSESLWKRWGSNFNLFVSEKLLDKPKGLRFENLSIIKRFVCDEVIRYKNPYPFMEGLFLRVSKRVVSIPMKERSRIDGGRSGFTLFRSIALFANGFTNFSVKPLRTALVLGMLFAVIGFLYGLIIIIKKIISPGVPMGWSSMMAVNLFSSGVIMILLGVIGEYVGRIFICLNDAPQYVVKDTMNLTEGESDDES